MIFYDSVSFEINIHGTKAHAARLVSFLKSGELDDFFEVSDDMLSFDDDYDGSADDAEVSMLFSSDEFGVEVEEFDSDEFLEVVCKAARHLHLSGSFYNFDDDEFRFISEEGDSYYVNADSARVFNDELDAEAAKEDDEEDDL